MLGPPSRGSISAKEYPMKLTVQLEGDDYARLAADASRRGIPAGEPASQIVRAHYAENHLTDEQTEAALAAQTWFHEFVQRQPPVHVSKIMRESREELEQRPV